MGSIFAARRTGTYSANKAMPHKTIATKPNVIGSVGLTPNSMLAISGAQSQGGGDEARAGQPYARSGFQHHAQVVRLPGTERYAGSDFLRALSKQIRLKDNESA